MRERGGHPLSLAGRQVPASPAGGLGPAKSKTETQTESNHTEETPTRIRTVTRMVCDHCGSKAHRTGSSNCSKYCALCQTPRHRQKSGSCPFRECSKCKAVGHSARECRPLTTMVCAHCALKRIQRITLTAQSTARCAKRPVIDRSVARARSASVASAKKLDTRLKNAERETFAPLRMTPMRKVSMMLTIRNPAITKAIVLRRSAHFAAFSVMRGT
jgi:hypothetical protein